MTFSQLLGKSIDDLEKMSYEELYKYFEPYLKVTRPELAPKTIKFPSKNTNQSISNRKQMSDDDIILRGQKKLIQQMLATKGIKIKL